MSIIPPLTEYSLIFSTLVYTGSNDKINKSGSINKHVKLIDNLKLRIPKIKYNLLVMR